MFEPDAIHSIFDIYPAIPKAIRLGEIKAIDEADAIAIAAILAIGFGVSVSAAKRTAPPSVGTFEQCEQLAIERGVPHGQTGHTEFVQQCMGQRPKGRPTG